MSWWGASLLILTMSGTLILFKNEDVHTQSIIFEITRNLMKEEAHKMAK